MKKLIILMLVMIITYNVFAQAPQKMSYQCVIRNASGVLVTNQSVGIRISILQGTTTGTPVYVETQTPNTNDNGLVSLEIGGGTIVTGTFAGINWSSATYFLKTETDPTGSTNYSIIGTSQLLSVPYAFYANTTSNDQVLKQQIKTLEDNLIAAGTYKLSDIEGNQYNVVKIGTQTWMAENLKTTKYNDGTAIPNITDPTAWAALTTSAYSDYNDDPANSTTYGRLYNWYTVDNNASSKVASNDGKNVCPTGWHVPSDAEWTTLTTYLGGESVAGGKLKETGTTHWTTPNTGATNETGFLALPGGGRAIDFNGTFYAIEAAGCWWSSTVHLPTDHYPAVDAFYRFMYYNDSRVRRDYCSKHYGSSVRCIRD